MKWWQKEGVKPLLEVEEDGQYVKRVYARKSRGEWEYVIVTLTDGDGDVVDWVRIRAGKVTYPW